jgi:hypothetical protein
MKTMIVSMKRMGYWIHDDIIAAAAQAVGE